MKLTDRLKTHAAYAQTGPILSALLTEALQTISILQKDYDEIRTETSAELRTLRDEARANHAACVVRSNALVQERDEAHAALRNHIDGSIMRQRDEVTRERDEAREALVLVAAKRDEYAARFAEIQHAVRDFKAHYETPAEIITREANACHGKKRDTHAPCPVCGAVPASDCFSWCQNRKTPK